MGCPNCKWIVGTTSANGPPYDSENGPGESDNRISETWSDTDVLTADKDSVSDSDEELDSEDELKTE